MGLNFLLAENLPCRPKKKLEALNTGINMLMEVSLAVFVGVEISYFSTMFNTVQLLVLEIIKLVKNFRIFLTAIFKICFDGKLGWQTCIGKKGKVCAGRVTVSLELFFSFLFLNLP